MFCRVVGAEIKSEKYFSDRPAAVSEWRNLIKNVEGREGTTVCLLVFVVRLDALGVVDHQLSDISEEKRDVVVMPGTALNIGTAPIFPHEIIIFLVCFVPQNLLLPHHVYFVSRHNQLETQVGPDDDNNQKKYLLNSNYKLTISEEILL